MNTSTTFPGTDPILPSILFQNLLFLNILAFLVYMTTGFAPTALAIGFLAIHAGLWLLGQQSITQVWVVPAACVTLFVWNGLQWNDGVPIILVLSSYTAGTLALQTLTCRDFRGVRQNLILSNMLVLASSAMNVNFFLPLALFPYLFQGLRMLFLLGACEQREAATSALFIDCTGMSWRSRTFVFLMLAALWLTLFYVTPRGDVIGTSSVSSRRLIGFSESLQLGEVGSLLDNPTVVMRVRPLMTENNAPGVIRQITSTRLRGCSFVAYKRGNWSRASYGSYSVNMRRNRGELRIRQYDDNRSRLLLEIMLESTDPPVLFIPEHTEMIFSSLPLLNVQTDGSVSFFQRRPGTEVYRAMIRLGRLNPGSFQTFESYEFPMYLRPYIDPGDSSEMVKDLALSITQGTRTFHESVLAVQSYLRRTCTYSLESTIPPGIRDPTAYFLFQSRSGSCEHFASALVLLLRSLGIPARPVNGYVLEEWNEFGNFFTVRQSDAHSWAEVFYPERGWTTVDPTPPNSRQASGLGENLIELRELWSRFEAFWLVYFYSFDHQTQIRGFRAWRTQIQRIFSPQNAWSRAWLLLLVVLTVGLVWRRFSKQQQGNNLPTSEASWIPGGYVRWAQSFAEPMKAWETPFEFHRRLILSGQYDSFAEPFFRKLEALIARSAFSATPHPWSDEEFRGALPPDSLRKCSLPLLENGASHDDKNPQEPKI
jgi:hypothetical protein